MVQMYEHVAQAACHEKTVEEQKKNKKTSPDLRHRPEVSAAGVNYMAAKKSREHSQRGGRKGLIKMCDYKNVFGKRFGDLNGTCLCWI